MPRGGKRPGAGRPPKPGGFSRLIAVKLSEQQIAKLDRIAKKIGATRSDALRQLIDRAK